MASERHVWCAVISYYMEGHDVIGLAETLTAAKKLVAEWRRDMNKSPLHLDWKQSQTYGAKEVPLPGQYEASEPNGSNTFFIEKMKVFKTRDFQ